MSTGLDSPEAVVGDHRRGGSNPGCQNVWVVHWGRPVVVHYWADLQSVHGFCCYDNTDLQSVHMT